MAKKQVKIKARTLARHMIKQMNIDDGDVIVLKRTSDPGETLRIFNALRSALGATNRERCIVVVVNELEDIKLLSEAEMEELGWIKAPFIVGAEEEE